MMTKEWSSHMSAQVRRWENRLLELAQEWKQDSDRQTQSDLSRWNRHFAGMHVEYQGLVSGGLWVSGPADFLNIIGRAEDERTHSRILAWLLTPADRHGLGNLVLLSLLNYYDSRQGGLSTMPAVQISAAANCLYKVDCSFWLNGREADIVARGDDFTLVVEMKVNAGEPTSQCDDLYTNFANEPGARFLFLTRDGRRPTTATTVEAQRAFLTISWPEVGRMIEDALNDPVSTGSVAVPIVENYLITLRENFG